MLFNLIFGGLLVAGWLTCAFIPWLVLSVATRGNAGLKLLPLVLFTGLVAALAVPILGLDDATGLGLSFIAATLTPALLLAVHRYAQAGNARAHVSDRSELGPRSSELK